MSSTGKEMLEPYGQLRRAEKQEQRGRDAAAYMATKWKPRLQWSPELHDKFVEAVNTLGGPSKATPKQIASLMNVRGVDLYHVKSHLQKYRQGKISKRSLRRSTPAQDIYLGRIVGNSQASPSEQESAITNTFGRSGLRNEYGAEAYGTRLQRVQVNSLFNTEQGSSSANTVEGLATTTSSISPLFWNCGNNHSSQARHLNMHPFYFTNDFSLGANGLISSQPSMESFMNMDPNVPPADDNFFSGNEQAPAKVASYFP